MRRLVIDNAACALKGIPSSSVDLCVTSPPYFRQRSYVEGEMGQEATACEYVDNLVAVFADVRRVLKPSGSLWLNLGDKREKKRLLGLPWRVALALQDDGWILRADVIWHKTRHKPEKAGDRPTTNHEYLFLLTKSARYFYDGSAIEEPATGNEDRPQHRRALAIFRQKGLTEAHLAAIRSGGISDTGKSRTTQTGTDRNTEDVRRLMAEAREALGGYYREFLMKATRPCRSVWSIPTTPYKKLHYAVFPEEIPRRCIAASSPSGGVVLDPFAGSGTTLSVAQKLGRSWIGIDLDPSNVPLIESRTGFRFKADRTEDVQGGGA